MMKTLSGRQRPKQLWVVVCEGRDFTDSDIIGVSTNPDLIRLCLDHLGRFWRPEEEEKIENLKKRLYERQMLCEQYKIGGLGPIISDAFAKEITDECLEKALKVKGLYAKPVEEENNENK